MRQVLSAAILAALLSATTAMAQWVVKLPQPTGSSAVGATLIALVDLARAETFTEDPSDRRELLLRIWYPAKPAAGAEPDPFWGRETQDIVSRLAEFMRLPKGALDDLARVPSHAYPDAPLEAARSRYPVLVFSHGYIPGLLAQNTVQMEELASHGYVVVSIGHTYETLVTRFPDGRVVPFSPARLAAFGQGAAKAGALYARYAATTDSTARESLLRQIVAEWPVLDESLRIWAADTRFVLDELERMHAGKRRSSFAGRLDLNRIGIFGMSFGGATAGQVCAVDSRCRAGINLDGLQSGEVIDRPMERPFLFMQSEAARNVNRLPFERAKNAAYYLTVKGSAHFNYSDFSLFSPDYRKAGVLGPIDGARMERIVNDFVLAFFDKYLKGKDAPLLDGPPPQYPEVEFEARAGSAKRNGEGTDFEASHLRQGRWGSRATTAPVRPPGG
ncbi:MAG: alpha/beta hydrolase family protein [Gemmatimonadales bacterium]